jgi:glycosyltransferase involved in cell wall biosynthesis
MHFARREMLDEHLHLYFHPNHAATFKRPGAGCALLTLKAMKVLVSALELRAAHIYLLPSLRDSAGITLAEAMLAGCVPVVADCAGPGEIVTEEMRVQGCCLRSRRDD